MFHTMTKREKIIILVAVILLLGIIGFGFYFQLWQAKPEKEIVVPVEDLIQNSKELQEKKYTAETPKDSAPTKPTETIMLENGNGNQQGIFAITASASGYTPASITVKSGDIITFQLTAQGADYDMFSSSMGFYLSAKKGTTEEIGFKTSLPGTFLFECRDNCPLGGKIQGTIIVLP